MEGGDSELQDWEVLSEPFIDDVAETEECSGFVEGMIQTNYFSLDSVKNNIIVSDYDSEVSCKNSDEGFETRYPVKHFDESLSELSSELFDGKRVSEFEGKYDVGFVENDREGKFLEGVDRVEHMVTENEGKLDVGFVGNSQNGNSIEGFNVVEHMVTENEGKLDVGIVENDQNGKFVEGIDEVEHLITENDRNGNFLEGFNGVEKMVTEREGKCDVGIVENYENGNFVEGFNGVEHIVTENEGKCDVGFVQNGNFVEPLITGIDHNGNFREGFNRVEHMVTENDENLEKFSDDSSGVSSGETTVEDVHGSGELVMKEDEISGEGKGEREASEGKGEIEVRKVEEKGKKSGIVWWKLPIEFLRYCVFKGPVWTVSVAAAFMGFIILGRRLHRMKKKSKALGPRITMDDKKISQFMSHAARLNEAFSVVKRVPIIRPSLPAGGVTSWPVLSLR